ncbi:MAG: hypothetical protein ACI8UD_001120 [Planctomycetota bacterium]|jgi:hypothetical protein
MIVISWTDYAATVLARRSPSIGLAITGLGERLHCQPNLDGMETTYTR